MSKISKKIKEEIVALLPPTLFFFITLHFIVFLRALMLEGTNISIVSSATIAMGALILGKAVLITELLPFVNLFSNKPLIFNVVWKTTLYFLAAMLIHYLERLIDFWREAGGFIAGNQKLFEEIVWSHFWAINILLVVLILNYCIMSELVRVIEKDKLLQIFFGGGTNAELGP